MLLKQRLVVAVALVTAGVTSEAYSQSFVASYGTDGSSYCTREAPCRSLSSALTKTVAGGTIKCMDTANYGTVVITKSITISCEDARALIPIFFYYPITITPQPALIVNAAATDLIVLRGLDFFLAEPNPSNIGIRFNSGGSLKVEDCTVRNSINSPGILFAPSSGKSTLHIVDTVISGNGTGTEGAGVQIAPTGSGSADVTIIDSNISNNVVGVRADTNGTTGSVDLSVINTVVSENKYHGIVAMAPTTRVYAMVAGSTSSNNLGDGIRSIGANASFLVSDSVVTGNGTGVVTVNGGKVYSYGDNRINGNTAEGVTPTIIAKK